MGINWGNLKEQGRVKDINIPWSDAELKARYELGISADLVRKGILTLEEAELEKATPEDDRMLRKMSKEELKTLATELGIEFPVDAKRLEILSLINKSKLPTNSD